MRHRRTSALLAALASAAASVPARAGHDHGHHDHAPATDGTAGAPAIVAAAALIAEGGATRFGPRDLGYATLALGVSLGWRRLTLGAHLPAHRIVQDGEDLSGLGDPHLELAVRLVEAGGGRVDVGLGAMLPVGSADDGLGMGHTMLMPAARVGWTAGRLSAGARVGYARATGGDHQHGVPWPLVAPMNAEQIELGGNLAVALGAGLSLAGSASLAEPIGDGDRIADLALRAARAFDRLSLGLSLGRGALGSPIGLHAGLDVGGTL